MPAEEKGAGLKCFLPEYIITCILIYTFVTIFAISETTSVLRNVEGNGLSKPTSIVLKSKHPSPVILISYRQHDFAA